MGNTDTSNRRTEYSKSGCRECKRRKIKCDEFIDPPPEAYSKINHQGRESCWQCTRLRKTCEYPPKGERVARVSRKVLLERSKQGEQSPATRSPEEKKNVSFQSEDPRFLKPHPALDGPYQVTPSSRNTYHVPGIGPSFRNPDERVFNSTINEAPGAPSMPHFDQKVNFAAPVAMHTLTQTSSTNSRSSSGSSASRSYDSGDLALIATDLNNLVSDMIFEVNSELKTDSKPENESKTENGNQLPDPQVRDSVPQNPRSRSKSYSHIPRNVGIGIFDVTPKERVYLQEFYSGFASVILPFNAYDVVQSAYYNPMRDILFFCAYNESFMLAAILAQGARSVFLHSNASDDEFAYYKYLSKCLELLGPALGDQMSKVESSPLPNIEAVLLTVLLLTSSNASNSRQNWRPHLRGAKDILLKHTTSRKDLPSSKLLLLCKYWFISFEILAGLGSKFGGTVESDDELDLLFSYSGPNEIQVLANLGLISQNGFYLIGGYHIEMIPAWKDLIKLLRKKRNNPNYINDQTLEYLRLLAIFEQQNNTEFVNKKALLQNSDFVGGFVPAGILLDLVTINRDHIIVSWMDISQQLYCLAAAITILTEFLGLSYNSPQIQCLVCRLTSFLDFLTQSAETPPLIKCAVMMIQWPMLVAGTNSIREKDQDLVLKFFDMAMKAGAGSAGYTISRMRRLWKNREAGVTENIDDNVDVVHY